MPKRFTVPIGWFLGVASLVLMLLLVRAAIGRPPRAPTARLPDGSRLRIVSAAYAAATNLTAPPHRLLGVWRPGLPYGFPVATTSGLPELLVLLEREGWKRGNAGRPARGAERMVMLDARDEVASVGRMMGGFGSSGPLWETENRMLTFGSLTNQGPIVRLAVQVPDATLWKTLATLAVTNPAWRTGTKP